MGDWIGHGATPNNWRSLGTDVAGGRGTGLICYPRPACALGLGCRETPGKGATGSGKRLFGGERNKKSQ